MDSNYLLVIDASPERVQTVNSILRNAGIAIQIVNASSANELNSIVQDMAPFLILLGTQLPAALDLDQVLQLAHQSATPVALMVQRGETGTIKAAISYRAVLIINGEDNEQLRDVVRQQLCGAQATREYDSLQQKLEELQQRYDLLLDSAHDAVAYIHAGLHVYANQAYLKLLQVKSFGDIEGISVLELFSTDDGIGLKKCLRDMNKGILPDGKLTITINLPNSKGMKAKLTFLAARFNGEKCIQMMVCPQDAKLALKEELERLRGTDLLTLLPNRKNFTARVDKFIANGRNEALSSAILYIEADDMAQLQQDVEMESVDTCILDLANIIRACIDADDLPARYSEHGFAVLVQRADKATLQATANTILESYNEHIIDLGEQTKSASCSIGIATIGALTKNANEVIQQARKAFREAAIQGNSLVRYRPTLKTVSCGEADRIWVERIRYALNNHEFYTVQQSIVDLEGENEGLFENLSFMREEQGDTAAAEFMPAAEHNEMGSTIDRHIIPKLMHAIAGTGDKHIIPLSSNSINDFSFANWFQTQLRETGAEASQLLMKISAMSVEANLKPTQRMVEEFQDMGCGIVLSEFDNDRKTIQLLDLLPVNMVKLRPGLASGLSTNTINQETIRAAVRAVEACDSGIMIIADEVQDAADLATLWQCGVRLVSGDFLNEAPQVVGQ